MKRTENQYCIELESESQNPYINEVTAILAATSVMTYFTLEGYLTTCYMSSETGHYEVQVHFDLSKYPTLPTGYSCTKFTLTSHDHWVGNEYSRIRCKTFYFSGAKK